MKPSKTLLKSIESYYLTLREFEHQWAFHEGAVSVAFQTLLADAARAHGWTLIPQLSDKRAAGGIRPDGTLKDQMNLVRGHWEAKDTSDNLDGEFIKKSKKGYPIRLKHCQQLLQCELPVQRFSRQAKEDVREQRVNRSFRVR